MLLRFLEWLFERYLTILRLLGNNAWWLAPDLVAASEGVLHGGGIYVDLEHLENGGLVERKKEEGPPGWLPAHYFHITPRGRRVLDRLAQVKKEGWWSGLRERPALQGA